MSLTTLLACGAAMCAYFAIRAYWTVWQATRHGLIASWWVQRTRQGVVVLDEMCRLWSTPAILFDLPWHWSWRRYVQDQERWDEANAWLAGQLARTDLDLQTFAREMAPATAQESAPESAPVPETPAVDPSVN